MAIPEIKVEIGFNLVNNPWSPFFVLGDNTKGRLDNSDYRLAGPLFYDVSEYVISINSDRGRAAILADFPPGECKIEFTNHTRAFDPLYVDSPFYPEIVPRREVRVSSGGQRIFSGWIEDWDLGYQPSGDSVAIAKAVDTLSIIGNQTLDAFTPSVEKAGDRINAVLDRPEVNWPATARDIDDGVVDLAANSVSAETNALVYLQNVAASDPGYVFITADEKFAFRDRSRVPKSTNIVDLGEGGIPATDYEVVYGSELLFNRVTVSRQNGGTAIASDIPSQDSYGIRDLTINNIQLNDDADLVDWVLYQASLYSQPEYRFNSVGIALEKLPTAQQDAILGLEIGDICSVSFTPNNLPPQIVKNVEVREIKHEVQTNLHRVRLGFDEIRYAPLVLDDAVFGKLDVGTLDF